MNLNHNVRFAGLVAASLLFANSVWAQEAPTNPSRTISVSAEGRSAAQVANKLVSRLTSDMKRNCREKPGTGIGYKVPTVVSIQVSVPKVNSYYQGTANAEFRCGK